MRVPAIEKAGFYPTHDAVVEVIKTYIQPQPAEAGQSRLLDPCCGEGRAASILGAALNCQTWGAELSYTRAAEAAKVMDKVHLTAWEVCMLTEESVNLLFLNPPYDNDRVEHQGRLEASFLKSSYAKLVRGGLLVYIVPQKALSLAEIAKVLAGYFENFTIGRYEDSAYGQVVILAVRSQAYHVPMAEDIEKIRAWATADLPVLGPAAEPIYTLAPAPVRGAAGRAIIFKRSDWTDEEVCLAALEKGVTQTAAWKDLLNPRRAEGQLLRPAMPLKKGHIAMLMASGMMGVVRLKDQQGKILLVKGRVVKVQEVVAGDNEDAGDEDEESDTETIRDRFVTTVATVQQSGIKVISDVKGLTEFMGEHGESIAAHVLETYRPLYNMDPTDRENAVLDTLGKGRKLLPGQSEPGLLMTQRHVAVAMARSIRANGVGNLQGEMGSGKSISAAGVTALLDAFPAIVICPPHLVPKWIREIEETIPGAKAVELRRIGRNADDPGDINDVKAFFDAVEAGTLGEKPVAVVANTSAKMGPGWKPAVATRTIRELRYGKWHKRQVLCCPKCGHPVMDDRGSAIAADGKLPKRRLFCQGQIPGWEVDGEGRLRRDNEGNPIWGKRACANPLFVFDQSRRWSIAEYISKHCKGKFKLLIADEVHQFKGQSSDRGIAFHQLVTACKWTLTLTGTFFGGKSTSIFWLLYRLSAGVRRDFIYDEETRWAKLYGVLESKVKRRDDDSEDGIFTGNRRRHSKAKEQPGISPAIINRLLDTTAFLSLKDLGIQLPGYQEEVITLDMPDSQGHQYYNMDRFLKQQAMDDSRYLSVWLQWSLARPNSGFRDEAVIVEGIDDEGKKTGLKKNLMDLPAVIHPDNEGLPKESWLANYCLAERQQGRKVLVYLRQTGTRDIQDRVQAVLEKAGLRVTVLHGSIDPRKREEWIAKRTPTTDVLVCNPKLVETGLDLIAYSTVIFYEIEYSLYTLWQAVRRVWRLGQTQAVKALFSVYEGAMESVALALMGRKMKAAQLLYGDEVGGAIVPESEGDFLTQLARELLAGSKLPDLATLFAEDTQVSHNPLGSMTVPSVVMTVPLDTWEDWLQQRGVVVVRKKRRATVPGALPGQASLF